MSRFQKLGMVRNREIVIILSIPNQEEDNHDLYKTPIIINQQ